MKRTIQLDYQDDEYNFCRVRITFDDKEISIRAEYYVMDYGTGNRMGPILMSEKCASVPVAECQSIEELRRKVIRAASAAASRNISGPVLKDEYFERYKQIMV